MRGVCHSFVLTSLLPFQDVTGPKSVAHSAVWCGPLDLSILLVGQYWSSHNGSLTLFSSVSNVHNVTESVTTALKVWSQHSGPSPALSVYETANSILLKHWGDDGERRRINWTLVSPQYDSIKLGTILILSQNTSDDWEWQLQCWYVSDTNIGVSICKCQVVTYHSILHIISNLHHLFFYHD